MWYWATNFHLLLKLHTNIDGLSGLFDQNDELKPSNLIYTSKQYKENIINRNNDFYSIIIKIELRIYLIRIKLILCLLII